MAHQPKAYKKFVASAATATLVATAIVPVASAATDFKDVSKSYEAAVNYLVENGIAKGTTETTFGTNSNISRGDAAVMIANALKLDTTSAPDAGFQDVNTRVAGAVNAIVEAKIASGKTATAFAPADYITRQEMAKMLANAYKLTAKENANFKDVNNNWIGYVSALKEAGITLGKTETTFAPTDNLTRGEFALFVHRAEVGVEDTTVLSVKSAAVDAKTLEVTFNKAVDTTKAQLEVVKSTIKQNVSKTTWAADGKSVKLELSTKLTQGDYTINISGLTDTKLSTTVKAQDERVETIEILSDVAVVNATGNPTKATVGYQVKNQYGEDVTRTTTLTTNNLANIVPKPALGVVEIDLTGIYGAGNSKVGDKVAVALIHADSAKSATKTVTLSAAAAASEVAVTGVYNKDKKELNEGTNLTSDKFYLLLDVKDQYGNTITDKDVAKAGLIKSETNPTVVTTKGAGSVADVETVTVDGKTHLAIEIQAPTTGIKAGENQVTFISTTTGKNVSYKIQVAETTRTDVVTLSAPALTVAKEDILVPVSVLDKGGKAVTDLNVLNNTSSTDYKGVKVTFNGSSVANAFAKDADGNLFIKVPASANQADGIFPLVAQSSTFKVATTTVKVEKAAVPTTVRGLKDPLVLAAGKSKNITVSELVIEDQYGRDMKAAAVTSYLLANSKGILVSEDTNSTVVTLPGTTATNTIKHNAGVTVTAGLANGSETLQFVLADANGTNTIAASTAESTVRVTDGTEYNSYEIATIGKVQAADVETAGNKAFTVNGVLNGGKVALVQGANEDFTATISGGKGTATVTNNEIRVAKADMNTNSAGTQVDTEFTLRVTINATGEVLEQKFVVSTDEREVEDFFFTTATVAANHTGAAAITTATLASGSTVASNLKNNNATVNFATTDQYGNKRVVDTATATPTITVVPQKASEVKIEENGTPNAKVTLNTGVTEAKVTVRVKIENATKEIQVTVK
ncbi:S-layer homology domain-containing protein [Sporosarcina luteola]|uniref:S-layer homology domain-containing protein n=1 Tax=Sporosarcina luteola TaxID=582850 RepID=UPI002040DE12|nr:S-layer homology domain-containing protein [Sporosarcina luteola]MCM3744118.1 S-layer homology domain-containing protein [Sporosarcina luteola]